MKTSSKKGGVLKLLLVYTLEDPFVIRVDVAVAVCWQGKEALHSSPVLLISIASLEAGGLLRQRQSFLQALGCRAHCLHVTSLSQAHLCKRSS